MIAWVLGLLAALVGPVVEIDSPVSDMPHQLKRPHLARQAKLATVGPGRQLQLAVKRSPEKQRWPARLPWPRPALAPQLSACAAATPWCPRPGNPLGHTTATIRVQHKAPPGTSAEVCMRARGHNAPNNSMPSAQSSTTIALPSASEECTCEPPVPVRRRLSRAILCDLLEAS